MLPLRPLSECYILEKAALSSGEIDRGLLSSVVSQELRNRSILSDLLDLPLSEEWLVEALTHRSFLHENPWHPFSHQERWEFLGDSILGLLVTEDLFCRFPKEREGSLSKLRGKLVGQDMLTSLALFLRLDECLLLGKGELRSLQEGESRFQKGFLSDTFEALLGVLYLSQGLECVRQWFWKQLFAWEAFEEINLWDFIQKDLLDVKSALQQETLFHYKSHPVYRLSMKNRPHSTETFHMDLVIQGKEILSAQGPSKRQVEKLLASLALENNLYQPSHIGALPC
jgi:ribonuclease-3